MSTVLNKPLVSVVVPFFNVESYAEETIKLICTQTLKDIEIICVDDGSTDGTPSIIESLSKTDSRIRFVSQENSGAGAARNAGLDLATGEYVSILDSDDIYNTRMLETAFIKAQITDSDVVLYRSDQFIQQEDKYKKTPWVIKLHQLPSTEVFSISDIRSNRFFAFQGWAWDKLFKRSFIESNRLRFQNTRIYNDMFFVFAACLMAKRISYIDSILIHQRKRGGGSLSDAPSAHWESIFLALEKVNELIINEDLSDEIKVDFDDYVLHMVKRQLDLCTLRDEKKMRESIEKNWISRFSILSNI